MATQGIKTQAGTCPRPRNKLVPVTSGTRMITACVVYPKALYETWM